LGVRYSDLHRRENEIFKEIARADKVPKEIAATAPSREPVLTVPAGAHRSTRYRRKKAYLLAKAEWERAQAAKRDLNEACDRWMPIRSEKEQIRESVRATKATSLESVQIKSKILTPPWCRRDYGVDDLLALGGTP
jgi:hypothetical protein